MTSLRTSAWEARQWPDQHDRVYPIVCIRYAKCSLGERRRRRGDVRELLANAKVLLRLFEDETLDHSIQHKDGSY